MEVQAIDSNGDSRRRYIRSFEITIQNPEKETITIKPPFSVEISIVRNVLSSANTCSVTLYNLNEDSRNKIFKDRYTFNTYFQMIIKAGYGDKLYTIFQGSFQEAYSFKQGTEWKTIIEAQDGLYAMQNGNTMRTFNKGTSLSDMAKDIINDMPNTVKGLFSKELDNKKNDDRGEVLVGNSYEILKTKTDYKCFVDSETVNVLDNDEYIGDEALLLDSNQLLATPKRRDTLLDCEILFFPEAQVGYIAEVKSKDKVYDGQYKIMGFTHNIQIMGNQCGTAKTTINLNAGASGLKKVQ